MVLRAVPAGVKTRLFPDLPLPAKPTNPVIPGQAPQTQRPVNLPLPAKPTTLGIPSQSSQTQRPVNLPPPTQGHQPGHPRPGVADLFTSLACRHPAKPTNPVILSQTVPGWSVRPPNQRPTCRDHSS
jgi:hypothetical protein